MLSLVIFARQRCQRPPGINVLALLADHRGVRRRPTGEARPSRGSGVGPPCAVSTSSSYFGHDSATSVLTVKGESLPHDSEETDPRLTGVPEEGEFHRLVARRENSGSRG